MLSSWFDCWPGPMALSRCPGLMAIDQNIGRSFRDRLRIAIALLRLQKMEKEAWWEDTSHTLRAWAAPPLPLLFGTTLRRYFLVNHRAGCGTRTYDRGGVGCGPIAGGRKYSGT